MTRKHALFVVLAVSLPAAAAAQERPIVKKVREIQRDVERMRGLKFRAPVEVGVKKPEELKKMLFEDMDKEEPLEELRRQEKVVKKFGLVPQDFDLREDLLKFLGDRIGGFYLPEKKELYLVDRSGGGGMNAMQQKMNDPMVMAHELQHALQDQHFGLDRWFELLMDHEDRMQAYKCLTEGEAQLIGMSYMFGKGRREVDLKRLNRMNEMMMRMMPQDQQLPAYLQENMMFPYTQGAEFFQEVQRKIGWDKIAGCFADPPTSTEQILHPKKYYLDRDEPVEIRMPTEAFKKILGAEDVTELYENTQGEFNVSVLLRALGSSKADAARAAAGWDGDRFAGYETKDGRVVIVWLTAWDSEAEAQEFVSEYQKVLAKKRPNAKLVRRGAEVVLIDGSAGAEEAMLLRKAFRSVKIEEKWRPLPALTETPDAIDLLPESQVAAKLGEAPVASSGADARSTHGASSYASSGKTLVRADAVGASFTLPAGFKAAADPLGVDQRLSANYYRGPDGEHLRLISLPFSLQLGADAFAEKLSGDLKNFELKDSGQGDLHGATTVRLAFESSYGEDPSAEVGLSSLLAIDQGEQTLAIVTTVSPAKGLQAAQQITDAVSRSLWLDHAPEGQVQGGAIVKDGEIFKVSVPHVLPTQDAAHGMLFHSQSDANGAKVQVVNSDPTDLAAYAARTEARIPLMKKGGQVVSSGIVQRRGREVYELVFEADGRTVRQMVVQAGGRLWTVACSAPSPSFDSYRWRFGEVLGAFRILPGRKYRQPKKERKAYGLEPVEAR